MWHLLIITQHWVRKDTRKYQTSSATLKLIEMFWYQCSFQQTYLVKPPQIIHPVALLMFRVEVIQMFLPIVPIQICKAKLVLCFTGQSSMSTHWMWICTQIPITEPCILWISSVCWNKWLIFLFALLCLGYIKLAQTVDV
jgi:hypothetical protein